MSGEPMAIAFGGFIAEAATADPLAVSSSGYLIGASAAGYLNFIDFIVRAITEVSFDVC